MRRNSGLLQTVDEHGIKEVPTMTCRHCNGIFAVKPFCDPASIGGLCGCCGEIICPKCVGKGCDPLEEKLLRMEAVKSYAEG